MGLHAFKMGASIIAFEKNGIKYGMTCAWSMQTGYDRILCLVGSQSITGKNIEKGDVIGISALNDSQEEIANLFGSFHSDEKNKFNGIKYINKNNALLIDDAKCMMVGEVIDILHLKDIEEDNLLYVKVIDYKENEKEFYEYRG